MLIAGLTAREARQVATKGRLCMHVCYEGGDVEALLIVQPTSAVGHSHHLAALQVEQPRSPGAHIAKALHGRQSVMSLLTQGLPYWKSTLPASHDRGISLSLSHRGRRPGASMPEMIIYPNSG